MGTPQAHTPMTPIEGAQWGAEGAWVSGGDFKYRTPKCDMFSEIS